MKNKIDIKSLVLGALLGVGILFSIGAVTPSSTGRLPKEYKVVSAPVGNPPGSPTLEREINKAADEGWEFVQASDGGAHSAPFAILNRPKK